MRWGNYVDLFRDVRRAVYHIAFRDYFRLGMGCKPARLQVLAGAHFPDFRSPKPNFRIFRYGNFPINQSLRRNHGQEAMAPALLKSPRFMRFLREVLPILGLSRV